MFGKQCVTVNSHFQNADSRYIMKTTVNIEPDVEKNKEKMYF